MELTEVELTTLRGEKTSLGRYRGKSLLLVNVASTCGLTPQYAALQRLQERFGRRGFTVLAFPCDQFGHHEPGDGAEILAFTSREYGVTFPIFEKIEVNGPDRHPLYAELTAVADAQGHAGDVEWNFEKFAVSPELEVLARYRSLVDAESAPVVNTLRSVLPDPPGNPASRRTPLPGGKGSPDARPGGPRVR